MYHINFEQPIHIHFIGIGGVSMSGLAEILLEKGFKVSGSDRESSPLTDYLKDHGALIYYGQKSSNITDTVDLVVYTAAIHEDNEEWRAAKEKKIPMLTRAQLLGQLMHNYKNPIAISGTHGKTTATSMMTHILLAGETDPTISVGGILEAIGGNIRVGKSDIFVTEACEYTNSFLEFFPRIGIILNIEEDHLDFFKDIHDIRNSFYRFAKLLPKNGALIINGDIENYKELTQDLSCQIISFGHQADCDYYAKDLSYDEKGNVSFILVKHGTECGRFQLSVTGEHNVYNALSVIAASELLGLSLEVIQKGLASFKGTHRRFEYKGTCNGFTIVDDYAHHPTEILATLQAAKYYPHKELWCVFQPHTYTRTKTLYKEFVSALAHADHVVLADIYAARETDTLGMSSAQLAEDIKNMGADAYYLPSFEEIENFLLKHVKKDDLLITMGAGNVVNIGESLLK